VRRAIALVLLTPFITGCFATRHVPLSERTNLAKANGVTTRSGRTIEFVVDGATIANDTLRAVGPDGTITVPTDSIAQISVRKFSTLKTVGLTLGIGAVAFVGLGLVALNTIAID
jgi:hypothetical protein